MELTYDASVDAAYLGLDPSGGHPALRQVCVELDLGDGVELVIDIVQDRYIAGIEVIGASSAFTPEQLALMVRLDDEESPD